MQESSLFDHDSFQRSFFPNKKSCCVHVYMMFDSVWSFKINFMRKLSLGISSYSEITGFACDRAFQIPALSHSLSPQRMSIGLQQTMKMGRQREGRWKCLVALFGIETVK